MVMKKFSVAVLAISAILWSVWFFAFRHYLIWLEGYSFFSALPDFASQYFIVREGLPGYIGAFLHQFYSIPAAGAAIQAVMAILPVICSAVIVMRIFKSPEKLLWIAFLPLPVIIYRQFWDLNMYYTVAAVLISAALALVVLIVTCFTKVKVSLPDFMTKGYMMPLAAALSVSISLYLLLAADPNNKKHEEYARLEYLGENHRWEEILKTVSPKDAAADELKRAYALLALSESGLLTEWAFRYGLDGQDNFIFSDKVDPLYLNYNALFYQCNDMHNAVIHQAYQQGIQSVTGVSFSTVRRLADTYLALNDYDLARKYIDILSHSFCHKKWLKERLARLEAIRYVTPSYEYDVNRANIANFIHTISSMADRHRDNRKYADLLFCSLLSEEEGDLFKVHFRKIAPYQYPSGKNLPRLYEEALVLISMVDPQVLNGFTISEDTQRRFYEYVGMMNAGRGNQALRKHADTYWAYAYR